MSITLYSGTPGSGKSYHACLDIWHKLKQGNKGLITNFPLNERMISRMKKPCRHDYVDNSELTVRYLLDYEAIYHRPMVENQTLLIIDEAQVIFNARDFQGSGRQEWCNFFAQHRKHGFNIILIAQFDRLLDRQIRCLIETEVRHRKLNNYGFGGLLLGITGTYFVSIEYWYGGNKLKLGSDVYRFSKAKANIYNSFQMFDISTQRKNGKGTEKAVFFS